MEALERELGELCLHTLQYVDDLHIVRDTLTVASMGQVIAQITGFIVFHSINIQGHERYIIWHI